MSQTVPLLQVRDLTLHYPVGDWLSVRRRCLKALDRVSFEVDRGEVVGVVGESGSGKTSLSKCLLGLVKPTFGELRWGGKELLTLKRTERRDMRPFVQGVFQDPNASINPRRTVFQTVGDPVRVHRLVTSDRLKSHVLNTLAKVGLGRTHLDAYPHELSMGQRQRVAIARALILRPGLVICDEPVSALDVSIQAQILNLLSDLQAELGLALLFISHDLAVIRHMAERIIVLYFGRIVEIGPAEELFSNPKHPYTRMLLRAAGAAIPVEDGHNKSVASRAAPPYRLDPPEGCPFHPRCEVAKPSCEKTTPPMKTCQKEHIYRCIW